MGARQGKEGVELLRAAGIDVQAPGVVTSGSGADGSPFVTTFVAALGTPRFWERADKDSVPA